MSSFSFETKKHISTGEGGMVCTNNEEFAVKVRKHGGLGYKTLTAKAGLRNILPAEFQDPAYKRHDTLGYNYRMPECIAAIGLAQLERVDEFIERRKAVAKLYFEALDGCDWIVPQKVPAGYVHSYWTFAVRYEGAAAGRGSWKDFYNRHLKNGGDGFYGDLSLAYNEIVMQQRPYYGTVIPRDPSRYPKEFVYPAGTCPNAEAYQPKLMRFKTNYRDLDVAKRKIAILHKTINDFSK
jgi:perosamine synthetase